MVIVVDSISFQLPITQLPISVVVVRVVLARRQIVEERDDAADVARPHQAGHLVGQEGRALRARRGRGGAAAWDARGRRLFAVG